MQNPITKSPRLYTELDLMQGGVIELPKEQAHYLKNVLRKSEGDPVRLFNGRDGEWVYCINALGKKGGEAAALEQTRPQTAQGRQIHAFFPPIKKNRMDFMIEKAIELGATDLHPIITQNTETRKINEERLKAQIIEAAEQCERLDLPTLHKLSDMFTVLKSCDAPVYAAIERMDAPKRITVESGDVAVLIGPEGGFTAEEIATLGTIPSIKAVSLGDNILRAETALLKILCII